MPELRDTPPNGRPPPAEPQAATLASYLQTDVFKRHLAALLPKHMQTDRFASVCLRQLSQVPELQECSLRSVIGGMMEAATLGLEIGTQGECWLIPYKRVASLQVGVWGHMALAWRSQLIVGVQVDVVLEGDRFSFRKGTDGFLHHEPRPGRDLNDRKAIEWVYAVVRTANGGVTFDAFDAAWIERIRSRSPAPNSPAWTNFYPEQAQAKALKKVLKLCPKSRDMARAITLDDESDAGVLQEWQVDTSLLLPAEAALDPRTEAARKAMQDQQTRKAFGDDQPGVIIERGKAAKKPAARAKAAEPEPEAPPVEPAPGGGRKLGWD